MKCLRCGHCCQKYMVVIVKDPTKGLREDNLIPLNFREPFQNCPHLRGDGPGNYSCAVHDEEWYEDTPCFHHSQIERTDSPCRIGEYILAEVQKRDNPDA